MTSEMHILKVGNTSGIPAQARRGMLEQLRIKVV
jgi:hypothetical protein